MGVEKEVTSVISGSLPGTESPGTAPVCLPRRHHGGVVRADLHRRLGWILWQTSIVVHHGGSEVSLGGICIIRTDTREGTARRWMLDKQREPQERRLVRENSKSPRAIPIYEPKCFSPLGNTVTASVTVYSFPVGSL